MTRTLAATAALGLSLAACAPMEDDANASDALAASEAEGRSCFSPSFVSGFREAPDSATGAEQIYIDVGASDTYLFETFGGCPDLDFTWRIGLDQRIPGLICDGLDVDLVIPDTALGTQRCPVRMVRKLPDGAPGTRRYDAGEDD